MGTNRQKKTEEITMTNKACTKNKAFLKLGDIKELYDEHCQNIGVKFDAKEFLAFLDFLRTDFYDWVRENLRIMKNKSVTG